MNKLKLENKRLEQLENKRLELTRELRIIEEGIKEIELKDSAKELNESIGLTKMSGKKIKEALITSVWEDYIDEFTIETDKEKIVVTPMIEEYEVATLEIEIIKK